MIIPSVKTNFLRTHKRAVLLYCCCFFDTALLQSRANAEKYCRRIFTITNKREERPEKKTKKNLRV